MMDTKHWLCFPRFQLTRDTRGEAKTVNSDIGSGRNGTESASLVAVRQGKYKHLVKNTLRLGTLPNGN